MNLMTGTSFEIASPVLAVSMIDKLAVLWPEVALMIGAVICLMFGLSRSVELRRLSSWVAFASTAVALVLVPATSSFGANTAGVREPVVGIQGLRVVIAAAGLVLLLINAFVPSQVRQCRESEASDDFEPGDTIRGEFYFFFLMSLAGALLCCNAGDLPWLFLALELVSLPTYVMVATMRDQKMAQESGVKYFFLGALSAAIFLYGFALIYGATGFTDFASIREWVATERDAGRDMPDLLLIGMLLSVIGVSFKIAAFPMHFYAADVYQGATTAVTTFLAVIPKIAGFAALILLLSLVGWPLPPALATVLALIAVATMCIGNFLGLVQGDSVKRVLAYSSVAHSGYLIVGLLAGHTGGLGAIVFYLAAYAAATIAAFGVLSMLQVSDRKAESAQRAVTDELDENSREADRFEDLNGLHRRHPALAGVLALSMVSLIGLPPLVGFFGKLGLFAPTIEAGFTALVVIAVINSAISAAYYLRVAAAPYIGHAEFDVRPMPAVGRRFGVGIAAVSCVLLACLAGPILKAANQAPPVPEVVAEDADAEPFDVDYQIEEAFGGGPGESQLRRGD